MLAELFCRHAAAHRQHQFRNFTRVPVHHTTSLIERCVNPGIGVAKCAGRGRMSDFHIVGCSRRRARLCVGRRIRQSERKPKQRVQLCGALLVSF